ncbi:MAG: tripartite tricarboxylate transporter substrate binding protein [Burkholderiaceae bacterium]
MTSKSGRGSGRPRAADACRPAAFRRAALRASIALAIGAGMALMPWPAGAQADYPSRPISIVVGFPPGTATDAVARVLAERMSAHLKQAVVVENRPGGGGSLGAGSVARAPADGYTLLIGASAPLSINPHVYGKLPYDSRKDFAPIGQLTWLPYMLVVRPDFPAGDLKQLIALARDKPGAISFGSTGNGTTSQLLMEVIGSRAGVKFLHVPYKGSAQAQADIVGGQLDSSFDTLPSSMMMVKAGKLKPLAVSSARRNALMPDVPTVAEQGFPDFEMGAWLGLVAPAGTPVPVLDKLFATLTTIAAEDEYRKRIAQSGAEVRPSTTREAFAAFVARDYDDWGRIVREFGVKAD